jgi:hypothetical protein
MAYWKEARRHNQLWTIQRHRQHWAHYTKPRQGKRKTTRQKTKMIETQLLSDEDAITHL